MTMLTSVSADRMMRRWGWFVVLLCAAVVVPLPSFAQPEPTGIKLGPLMCYYGPMRYLPCNSPPPPIYVNDPFQVGRVRYEALLARLRAFGPTMVDGKPAPQTLEELSRHADTLFVGAAFRLDNLAYNSDRLVQRTKETESLLQTLYARERELKVRAAALPQALREANENLSRELARAEAQERLVASVETVADRMHARADRAATETLQWLTVASPPGALLVNDKIVSERKTAKREPLSTPVEPINLQAGRPSGPIALHPERPPGPRATPSGTAEDKLTATEALIPQLEAVTAQYKARVSQYKEMAQGLQKATSRIGLLEAAVGGDERNVKAIEDLYSKAQSRTSTATINGYRAGANAARAMAEAYILETFRDDVVIPEVKRFLRANGIMQKMDNSLVVQLYELRKSVLPAGQQWQALNRLMQTEKRALEVLPDFMTYALATAQSSGAPADTRAADLLREIEAGTEKAGQELIEKAAGDPGPLYSIVQAILRRR